MKLETLSLSIIYNRPKQCSKHIIRDVAPQHVSIEFTLSEDENLIAIGECEQFSIADIIFDDTRIVYFLLRNNFTRLLSLAIPAGVIDYQRHNKATCYVVPLGTTIFNKVTRNPYG